MTENNMPAAEANEVAETNSYELAFHVLPTVAEGEVTQVFDTIKSYIANKDGELGMEEAPARVELAYEIEKYLEGKYRRFSSAYFGWVRFTAAPEVIAEITEKMDEDQTILRHLLLKLTKVEEANPFYFHEAMAEEKKVASVDVEAALDSAGDKAESTPKAEVEEAPEAKAEVEEAPEAETTEADEETKA